MKIRYQARLC